MTGRQEYPVGCGCLITVVALLVPVAWWSAVGYLIYLLIQHYGG